ncbi:hypothetical protein Tco_0302977 [Tanacetum coccineum]
MPAYTPSPNWQPPIPSHPRDAGLCDPNKLERPRREQRPSVYMQSPYTPLPPTTELPKKRVGITKKKCKNDNLSPLNLGNAFTYNNAGRDDVVIMGVHDTVPHLCMPRSHSVDNPYQEGWVSGDQMNAWIEILIRSRSQNADWTVSKSGTTCLHVENNRFMIKTDPYIIGTLDDSTRPYPPWKSVNWVYMPINVGGNHCVTGAVNLPHSVFMSLTLWKVREQVASSEGVWCFAFGKNLMLLLWNPSIKKSVGISVPNYTYQPDSPKMIFGFGICPVTLEPTILKINYPLYTDGPWYVSVSTLSSRTWYNLDYDCLPRESIRIKRAGQAVIDGKIFWIGSERFYNDDGISNKIYLIVSFDLVTHQFHVQDMPEQVRVGEFSPPYYISQLGDSVIISGSFDFRNFCFIYAWALEVEGGFLSSCSLLFTIPHPGGHYLKLLGFNKDIQPIVEATIVQAMGNASLQSSSNQSYFKLGVEANRIRFSLAHSKSH